jgi:hypothetical protein
VTPFKYPISPNEKAVYLLMIDQINIELYFLVKVHMTILLFVVQWMPVDEFLNQQVRREDEMLRKIINICVKMGENNGQGFKVERLMSKFDNRISHLYCSDLEASLNE